MVSSLTSTFASQGHLTVLAASLGLAPSLVMVAIMKASQPLSWYLKVMSHGQFRAACCSIVLEFGLGVLLVQNFYRNRFLNYFHTLLIIPTFLCQLPLNPVHISKLHAVFYSKTLSHFTGNVQCFLMIPNILLIFLASSAQWADILNCLLCLIFSWHVSIWKTNLFLQNFCEHFLVLDQLLSTHEMFKLFQLFIRRNLIIEIR